MPNDISGWVAVITAFGVLAFGGGGLVAWKKQRSDSRNGVRQENRADIDSLNARTVAIVETQFNYLVKPLQEELDKVRLELKAVKTEVETHRDLYEIAVKHIRTLYVWIARHMPLDIQEETEVPKPPDPIFKDVKID